MILVTHITALGSHSKLPPRARVPDSQHVFEIISPAAVRKLKVDRPHNVEALLRASVAHLEKVSDRNHSEGICMCHSCVNVVAYAAASHSGMLPDSRHMLF